MKKIAILCLALVMALGSLGIGYAMWDKTLYIDGTVYTGEVDAKFILAFTDDDGTVDDVDKDAGDDGTQALYDHWGAASSADPLGPGPNPARSDKDVGKCTVVIDADPQVLIVTLSNAYPSYGNTIWYEIENTGSIPVKVQDLSIDPDNFTLDVEVEVWFTDVHVGLQIDPGEVVQGDLVVHVLQDADEDATYTFTAEIYLVQWNEYEAPD